MIGKVGDDNSTANSIREPLAVEQISVAGLPRFVLITPARNEGAFIENTIRSMISQTALPLAWIIVSDGSTDGTDDIVSRYAAEYPWIRLIRIPERRERHFAGKVNAFNVGYQQVSDLPYEVIGNLDADISFDADYIEHLLRKFAANSELGVAGTSYKELDGTTPYNYRFSSQDNVPGACQMFRRECFEAIGGYLPIKGGLIDTVAVMSARMKGWPTRTFTDRMFLHHRPSGTAQSGILTARFKQGEKSYAIGNHVIWELLRAGYQMTRKPYMLGGMAILCGYLWSAIRRTERPISNQLVRFHRTEQMQKLRSLLSFQWNDSSRN